MRVPFIWSTGGAVRRLRPQPPLWTVAVAQTSAEPAGSLLRVGSESRHPGRRERTVRRDVVAQKCSAVHFSERAAAFLRRLYATPTTKSRSRGPLLLVVVIRTFGLVGPAAPALQGKRKRSPSPTRLSLLAQRDSEPLSRHSAPIRPERGAWAMEQRRLLLGSIAGAGSRHRLPLLLLAVRGPRWG